MLPASRTTSRMWTVDPHSPGDRPGGAYSRSNRFVRLQRGAARKPQQPVFILSFWGNELKGIR